MTTENKNLSDEKLMAVYKKLEAMPPKFQDLRLKAIQTLEPAIRKMLEKKYSLTDICKKINNDLELKITAPTLTTYLKKIEADREQSLLMVKREATQAKREATRLAKANAIAPSTTDNGKVSESTELLKGKAISLSTQNSDGILETIKLGNAIAPSTIDKKSSSKNVLPKFNSIKSFDVATESKTKNISDDAKDLTQEEKEAEAERLKQLEMEKYFNKY